MRAGDSYISMDTFQSVKIALSSCFDGHFSPPRSKS